MGYAATCGALWRTQSDRRESTRSGTAGKYGRLMADLRSPKTFTVGQRPRWSAAKMRPVLLVGCVMWFKVWLRHQQRVAVFRLYFRYFRAACADSEQG